MIFYIALAIVGLIAWALIALMLIEEVLERGEGE